MKLIYKAADITEAHIIKGLLESNGIAAHVGGFYLQGAVGDLPARDYVNVHVLDEDLQEAAEIISEYESTNRDISPCTASNEESVFKKILLGIFALIVTIIIAAIFTD